MWQAAREELSLLRKAKKEHEQSTMEEVNILLAVSRH